MSLTKDKMERTRYTEFTTQLRTWLDESGWIEDRSWTNNPNDDGLSFYSYSKGKFRTEIKSDWDLKYGSSLNYTPITFSLLDCEKEVYCDGSGGYFGFLGQSTVVTIKEPFSRPFFDELLMIHGVE